MGSLLNSPTSYIDELVEFVGPASSLLEIGCGDGHNLSAYKQRFPSATVEGCDLTRSNNCDITKPLPYKDQSFDVVVVAAVLLMIDVDLELVIKELKRVAKMVVLVDLHDLKATDFSVINFTRKARDFSKWAKEIKECRAWPGGGYPIKGSLIRI